MADPRDLILGLCPFERADAALVEAVSRAGGLGILDLGRDATEAAEALAHLQATGVPFGVRIPEGVEVPALPAEAATLLVDAGRDLGPFAGRRVLVQVTSEAEARAALAAGAAGLVAKGHESGGRVGEEGSFVLLQRLRRVTDRPIWVQGGVGLRTAAACVVGGATGVVLDAQLALVRESGLPDAVKGAIAAMDGSETEIRAGYRVYVRPNLPVDDLAVGLPGTLGAAEALEDALLPAGQDAAFAAPLARRFTTAGALVRGLEAAIGAHLRQARAVKPLAPGAGVARTHGLEYPVAQGPMTRVSDVPAFAAAVSAGGGLPFLALSLMPGDRARKVLEETKQRLGDRPWGVGILGFVPPALRAEQLAAIEAVHPPAALIAGGRPAQARTLEAAGIPTFLHVPSPGLLELFLKDGARRFVFEGRECGGHVGPRTSFALWEAQVEKLLAFEALPEVEVLFAGGIHDDVSAAMVAALAAPLAARGARLGVLMGTAYLFTEEAVSAGAILPGFQAAALACEETRCLQTAPGHATRCVDGPYVRHFEATRARLEDEGRPADDVWAELEQLNLGRLRIAAKGVRRDGDALIEVDAADQAEEGMFMIGQVAALRDAVTTVAELHAEVSAGATERLAHLPDPPPLRKRPAPRPADVAIVGMSCFYPGSPDVHAFWANVVDGTDCVTEVPRERWDPAIYYDPESNDGTKTPSKWGGFLDAIDFDPLDYGIPPNSLAAVEPVQLLALEAARRALDDAGYAHRDLDRSRASVIFGAEAGTDLASAYGFRALWPGVVGELPPALDEALPSLTEDSFPGVLANVIAGRIANRLDLGGVNYTVDAACASSIAALDLSVKELRAGQSDVVLCGGADLHNAIGDYLLFASTHALSRKGRCAHLRRRGRRHRARGGGGGGGPQAPRGRRARRRPDLLGGQGRRRLLRRPGAGPHRPPQGGPDAGGGAGLRHGRGLPGRGGAGGGPRHRHRGRRPHRARHPHRGLRRRRGHPGQRHPGLGEVEHRPHQVRRRPRRGHQGVPGAAPPGAAAHPPRRAPEPRLGPVDQPLLASARGAALGRRAALRRGERVWLRGHQLPRGAGEPRRPRARDRARRLARRALPLPRPGRPRSGGPPGRRRGAAAAPGSRPPRWRAGAKVRSRSPSSPGATPICSSKLDAARAGEGGARGPPRRCRRRRRGARVPLPRAGRPAPGDARRPLRRLPGAPGATWPGGRSGSTGSSRPPPTTRRR